MKITSVRASAIRIPLEVPTAFSTRLVHHREYLLAWLTAEDGSQGLGYTYAGTSGASWLCHAIEELITPLLVGRDAFAIEDNWELVFRELLLLGRRGGLMRALSAVDIAAWDLLGRTTGRPLRELLGGTCSEIPAYASGGYYRPGDPIENVNAEIGRYRALGFVDFKIKIGKLRLSEEVARVRAAREAIGPDGRLALDANNAWRNVEEAMRAIRVFEPYDIWWLEEPLMPDDVEGHATLARRSPVAIATGEIEATRWGFARLIRERAAWVLQPDACVVGGVSEWMKVAHAAAAFELPIAPHWHANLHAQLAPAVTNCSVVEYFAPQEGIYNFEQVVREPLAVHDGRLRLSSAPGIGFDLDEDAVLRFEI